MVTMINERQVLSYPEAKAKYDGHWLLFDKRGFPPEEDMGYVVALGDGTDEDWKELVKIQMKQYKGDVFLIKGWVQKDDIYDSGIIEEV
jgi:co-chaperonin GroES (HSP10)